MFELGAKVGDYQILEKIGSGGMATVYRARHERLERDVAIKVLHPTFLHEAAFVARFEREAKIIARLDHPNIVGVYDFGEDGEQPYLVMQYVDGQTLKHYFVRHGLSLDGIAAVMSDLAAGLDYAHRQGVLHRDIKPSNMLIDREGRACLTDFGLARILQAGESTISVDMMLGTPHYLSPEQARGETNLTPGSDVYAFAVVLYELVTGSLPFVGDTPYAVIHGHIYSPIPLPSERNADLPPALDAVLARGLAKDPAERYASAGALMADFRAVLEGAPQPVAPPIAARAPGAAAFTQGSAAEGPRDDGVYVDHRGRRLQREREFDLGNIDFDDLGARIGSGVNRGAAVLSQIAAQIEEEFDSEARLRRMSPEERIRKRIEKRGEERFGLFIHGSIYLFVNLFLWFIFLSSGGDFPWPLFVTFFWGIGMFSHVMDYLNKYGANAARREARIQREVEEEMARIAEYGGAAKTKRKHSLDDLAEDGPIRLTEDGELSDSFVEENARYRAGRRN
jgi:tRNA A-37 threonylcarbamoyl transferase component Bud32